MLDKRLMDEQHNVRYLTQAYIDLHERNGLKTIHLQTNGVNCDTIVKENKVNVSDDLLVPMQECIDEKIYGDFLRGVWRRR